MLNEQGDERKTDRESTNRQKKDDKETDGPKTDFQLKCKMALSVRVVTTICREFY